MLEYNYHDLLLARLTEGIGHSHCRGPLIVLSNKIGLGNGGAGDPLVFVRWTPPDREIRVQALVGLIALCSCARRLTLTVHLFCMFQIGTGELMLGATLLLWANAK